MLTSRCARRSLLLLSLLAAASGLARADGWSHKGSVWTDSGGMSITLPAPFKISEHGEVLTAETGDGAVLTVTPAHSKADVQKVMAEADQVIEHYKVSMGPHHDGKRNGIEVTYAEGKFVMNEQPVAVTLAVFNRAQEYMVCQLLLLKKASPKYTPVMKGVFGSISSTK